VKADERKKVRAVLITTVIVFVLLIAGIYMTEENKKWKVSLTEKDIWHIETMEEQLKSLKGGELLELRDKSITLVRGPTIRERIHLKDLFGETYNKYTHSRRFCYNVIRIVKPDDPDHPRMSQKFLLQEVR